MLSSGNGVKSFASNYGQAILRKRRIPGLFLYGGWALKSSMSKSDEALAARHFRRGQNKQRISRLAVRAFNACILAKVANWAISGRGRKLVRVYRLPVMGGDNAVGTRLCVYRGSDENWRGPSARRRQLMR